MMLMLSLTNHASSDFSVSYGVTGTAVISAVFFFQR